MKRIIILSLFIILIYTQSFGEQLPKLVFSPHWLPQAQFAGYYVADKLGFYTEEGIDVDIVHPNVSVNAVERLKNEQSDIVSLFLITAISNKFSGIELVNIYQTSQNSALLFVSKKEKNITNLVGLNGKKIGVWLSGFDEVGKSMIRSNKCNVEWVPIHSSINMFMIGGIDAMSVMWYNEYHQIINSGINEDELNTIFFSDYGYNIPEDGLYCLNKTYSQRKSDLEKFVRASMKGWEYAKNHRPETLEIVLDIMRNEHVQTNKSHQSWMLDKVLQLIEPGTKNIPKWSLSDHDFQKAQTILIEGGYIDKKFNFSEFYKPLSGN